LTCFKALQEAVAAIESKAEQLQAISAAEIEKLDEAADKAGEIHESATSGPASGSEASARGTEEGEGHTGKTPQEEAEAVAS